MASLSTPRNHSTPSPPPGIRTPPTPRHGYSDPWEPYSPRKSARISSQKERASHRTPSPRSSRRAHLTSPRNSKKASAPSASQMVLSPTATPQKKRLPPMDSTRRSSGSLTAEGTANAAAALGLDRSEQQTSSSVSITRRSGMLPTPAKTPKKTPTDKNAASIKAIARNLFPSEEEEEEEQQQEIMPTPKKKRAPKKYSGISMNSFTAENIEDPIEIFTDSQDRVPELDESEGNPFYGESSTTATQAEPTKRRSKRKVAIPGEAPQSVDEALRREDGIVYVFRGKKVFRKFANNDEEEQDDGEPALHKPLTRSSIKPRRLFAPKEKEVDQSTLEDEEALTDVEEHMQMDEVAEDDMPQTPTDSAGKLPATPQAPRFGPAATPPDTKRTTRAGLKSEEGTPIKPKGRHSPFDDWPRVKQRTETVSSKRQGDILTPEAPKRARA